MAARQAHGLLAQMMGSTRAEDFAAEALLGAVWQGLQAESIPAAHFAPLLQARAELTLLLLAAVGRMEGDGASAASTLLNSALGE